MFFIQSFIVAILCWLASNTTPCYGFTIGLYTLGRPLVGGFICGIIFGDIQTGILLGCALQVVYLALVTPGGAFPVDIGFISYPAIAIALVSMMDAGTAVAVGSTIGVIGTFAITFFRTFASVFNHMEDEKIEQLDYPGITRTFIVYPQIMGFCLRAVPAFLVVYVGSEIVGNFIDSLPAFITTGLMALGGILPVVGVCALLTQSVRNKWFLLFFLFGFCGIVFMGLNIIGLTIVGGVIAFLYYRTGNTVLAAGNVEIADDEEVL